MKEFIRTINKILPITAKNILKELFTRVNTIIEFHKECSKWSLEFLDKYSYKPTPEPPFEVIQYARRKQNDRNYSLSPEFWKQADIRQWAFESARILSLNVGNYDWLMFLKKNIESPGNRARVLKQISEFNNKKWFLYGKDYIDYLAKQDIALPTR